MFRLYSSVAPIAKFKKPILFDSVFRAESNGTTHILRKCLWTEIWSFENVKIIGGSKLNFYICILVKPVSDFIFANVQRFYGN